MYKKRNLENKRFGKLIVLKSVGYHRPGDKHFWSYVKCSCGNEFYIQDTKLVNGYQTQCPNCSNNGRKTHGMAHKNKLYNIWASMKQRCNCKTCQSYKDYGGRGISVCNDWLGENGFEEFYKWSMENGYKENLTIDRIDVNGNYTPNNCRWVGWLEQARNKRNTFYVFFEGKKITCKEAEKITGIKAETIKYRIKKGWSHYDATHIPVSEELLQKQRKECLHPKKLRVDLVDKETNETISFPSMSSASRFLGHNNGYLSILLGRGKAETEKYYVKPKEYYY